MDSLMVLGFVIVAIALILWTYCIISIHDDDKYSDASIGGVFMSMILLVAGVLAIINGSKLETKEEVLKHLTTKGIIELRINKDNETVFELNEQVDSLDSGWRPLFFYLKK